MRALDLLAEIRELRRVLDDACGSDAFDQEGALRLMHVIDEAVEAWAEPEGRADWRGCRGIQRMWRDADSGLVVEEVSSFDETDMCDRGLEADMLLDLQCWFGTWATPQWLIDEMMVRPARSVSDAVLVIARSAFADFSLVFGRSRVEHPVDGMLRGHRAHLAVTDDPHGLRPGDRLQAGGFRDPRLNGQLVVESVGARFLELQTTMCRCVAEPRFSEPRKPSDRRKAKRKRRAAKAARKRQRSKA
jgi:hypothetical protein